MGLPFSSARKRGGLAPLNSSWTSLPPPGSPHPPLGRGGFLGDSAKPDGTGVSQSRAGDWGRAARHRRLGRGSPRRDPSPGSLPGPRQPPGPTAAPPDPMAAPLPFGGLPWHPRTDPALSGDEFWGDSGGFRPVTAGDSSPGTLRCSPEFLGVSLWCPWSVPGTLGPPTSPAPPGGPRGPPDSRRDHPEPPRSPSGASRDAPGPVSRPPAPAKPRARYSRGWGWGSVATPGRDRDPGPRPARTRGARREPIREGAGPHRIQ